MRAGITTAIAMLLALLGAGPALAQAPYPGGTGIQCDTSVVTPGGTLTCVLDACVVGAQATGTATFETPDDSGATSARSSHDDGPTTDVTVTSTVDEDGEATFVFDVPDNATGAVDVTLSCPTPDGGTQVLSVDNVALVQAPGGGDGGGVLGNTGGPFRALAILVATLLGAGAALLVVTGRRHAVQH